MEPCPHIANCEMYALLKLSGSLELWQSRYCRTDYTQCARYRLAQQNKPVPINLMPNGALLRASSGTTPKADR